MNPKVSIILTSYNKPSLVGKAIESVLGQTLAEWELFIMDDHSNEETTHVIKQYLDDPRIIYINSLVKDEDRYQKTRYAVLINQAIPLTRGTYISYLTDDTIYVPERLEVMLAFFEKNPAIDIVYSAQQVKFVDDQLNLLYERTRMTKGVVYQAANVIDHCTVMHTRAILEKVYDIYGGYWNENPMYWHNGDAAFWKRLNTIQPFHPIDRVLDITYKTPNSFQNLYQSLPVIIPNGTLLKDSSHRFFLIDQQQRRLISYEMLIYFKYNPKKVIAVPDPFLYKYAEGPPINSPTSIPNLRVIQNEKNELFYIENNKKRLLTDKSILYRFKFIPDEIVQVTSSSLEALPDGLPIYPTLLHNTCLPESKVFRCKNQYFIVIIGKLHPIDRRLLRKLNILNECIHASEAEINVFEKGEPIRSYIETNLR